MSAAIKYMGSKRALAPKIASKITRRHPNAIVLDVFSGTCAVGSELAPDHVLFANDVHAFAKTLASALFVSADDAIEQKEMSNLLAAYERNRRALTEIVFDRLAAERRALEKIGKRSGWKALLEFNESELSAKLPIHLKGTPTLKKYRAKPATFPYRLVTSYFSSAYFGVGQSIEIDSLRYAIDQCSPRFRDRYLYALIQALSHCAAAPGHFAQFLVPRDRKNTEFIARIRQRSVLARFLSALVTFAPIKCRDRAKNRTFSADATDLLEKRIPKLKPRNLIVYADPPYSRAQYSRYYHVLETIVLYDYPACVGKGRYRDNRFLTDFSRTVGVKPAMNRLLAAAAELGPIYISYPRNGLLSAAGTSLPELLKQHYKVVQLVACEPLDHSTLGGAPGVAAVKALEDVYYAGHK